MFLQGNRSTNNDWESNSFRTRSESTSGSADQNRLSPISTSSTRYEQTPLFPFRTLRDAIIQCMEMNQTNSSVRAQNRRASTSTSTVGTQSTPMEQGIQQEDQESNVNRSTNTETAHSNTEASSVLDAAAALTLACENAAAEVASNRVEASSSVLDAAAALTAAAASAALVFGHDEHFRELRLLGESNNCNQ